MSTQPQRLPAATVGELCTWLAPGVTASQLLDWPPDAFALALAVLQKSGTYLQAVTGQGWPPDAPAFSRLREKSWHKSIGLVGMVWRDWIERAYSPTTKTGVPALLRETVLTWLGRLLDESSRALNDVPPDLARDLLQIVSAADKACQGVGLMLRREENSLVSQCAQNLLYTNGRTLCRVVRPESVSVLPKQHTPQTGLTVRSLTHNVALVWGGEISAHWLLAANNVASAAGEIQALAAAQADPPLNLLVMPWPLKLHPSQFEARPGNQNAPDYGVFGFFGFKPNDSRATEEKVARFIEVFDAAEKEAGRIDGIIFPELALWEGDADALAREFLKKNPNGFFIAGIGRKGDPARGDQNCAALFYKTGPTYVHVEEQAKHHRWQLDERQIRNFGIGSVLNPFVRWWEHIELRKRRLTFVTFRPSFTATILICEDLARQEPASEILRAIGPNLVVALLMDGPQLASRWPSRYATVLADDPGSSVLTVTSLGMAELSRPPGTVPSRVIAQWKDPLSGVQEIAVEAGAEAVILSLSNRMADEWTADGRSDDKAANLLALSAVHQVRAPRTQ